MKIIIVGHKNPDTDSIVSAIAAEEYISKVLGKQAIAMRAGEINNETKYILESLNVAMPELVGKTDDETSVVLVDHNQASQTFDGLEYSKVDYIFDHHNLNIQTEKPIYCCVEPLGSTCSVLAKLFFQSGIEISENSAKLMIAGILSDTLNFTSPTTTPEDKDLVAKLNEIAKLDVQNFVDGMFKAKSSLEGISTEQIISLDYKEFEMGSKKVGVGTWETTYPESVNEKKESIENELKIKKQKENLDFIFFMVVDILKQNCQLYLIGEEEKAVAEKVFGGQIENGMMILPGVVSRKKQIIPQLTEELAK